MSEAPEMPQIPVTPPIEAALAAVAEYLSVPQADLALAFPVWPDGSRGVVVAYVPAETNYQAKLSRFSAALNKQYNP